MRQKSIICITTHKNSIDVFFKQFITKRDNNQCQI